jgi:hypothetical protein
VSRSCLALVLVACSGTVWGCAEPLQSGGLGVINPNGLDGRLALVNRVRGSTAARTSESVPRARHDPHGSQSATGHTEPKRD